MTYEAFLQLAETRHSCREFTGEAIEEAEIEKILAAARLTPSACNSQPWRIAVVTEPEKKEKVALALQDDGMNPYVAKAGAFLCLYPNGAAMKKRDNPKHPDDHFVKYDVGELCAYITLAAETLGVASLIVGWVNPQKVNEAVGYEGEYTCDLVIALGKSAEAKLPRKIRKPMDEIAFS